MFRNSAQNDIEDSLKSKYREAIDLCDKMMSDNPNKRPNCSEIMEQINLWSLNKIVLTQELYFKLSKKSSFFESFIFSMVNLNPIYVLCDCGLEIQPIDLIDHQNNCIHSLKKQLEISQINRKKKKKKIKEMALKVSEENKEEFSVLNEWNSVKQLKLIKTNMPQLMRNRLNEMLTHCLNNSIAHTNNITERLQAQFGGNWNMFILNKIVSHEFYHNYYIMFEFGKAVVLLLMNSKPVSGVLVLEEIFKTLDNAIKNKAYDEGMLYSWTTLHNLTDDSFTTSEKLLDKNIINYFIQCNDILPNDENDFFNPTIGVFANISEFSELRYRLMEPQFISIVVQLISNQNDSVSYLSSAIMANILSEGKPFWEQHIKFNQVLEFDSIKASLKSRISEWKTDSLNQQLVFHSLKPLSRLLQCNHLIPQEVHYFAVWTLNCLTKRNWTKYRQLLTEDNCIQVLEKLLESGQTEECVRKLAESVLAQNYLFQLGEGSIEILQSNKSN